LTHTPMAPADDLDPDPYSSQDVRWIEWIRPHRLFSLAGRVAVVTGAAGGIGRWLAAGFGFAGAAVVVNDRDESRTNETVTWLASLGVKAEPCVVDLMEPDSPRRVVFTAVDAFGRLDVLVNNAGINVRRPMLEVSGDDLRDIWTVDYIRCYELSQEAARVMLPQGGGAIIHVASVNVEIGLEDVSLLGPTKAALGQLAKVMTVEFAEHGIRTNAIAPGFMATPMNAGHWRHPTRAPWIFDRTPMRRPGHPAELVGVALLLASDAGSYLSGQTIYVDGGFLAGSRWNVPPGSGLAAYRSWLRAGCPVGLPDVVEGRGAATSADGHTRGQGHAPSGAGDPAI
jgi:NAD(P)-dependent dehydrogenase (short-subunit alcohol dehydrogenase family)